MDTYLSVLLEKFPNIPRADDTTPQFCPHQLFRNVKIINCYDTDCIDCWNIEYKEDK